jgi:hypothetical protein
MFSVFNFCCCFLFCAAVLQGQSEQLSDVTTRLHKALTKLELCQGQLEKKQREVKELQEAAKVGDAPCALLLVSFWHAYAQGIHSAASSYSLRGGCCCRRPVKLA